MAGDFHSTLVTASARERFLLIRGAKTRCLKNLSLDLPLGKWIAVLGVSGAGKTSLVRDTILAESQRRFLDSLSLSPKKSDVRFSGPEVDQLDGLPPSFSMGRDSMPVGPRATISTVLRIQRHLATIFCRLGSHYCPDCRYLIRSESDSSAAQLLSRHSAGTKLQLGFIASDPQALISAGFSRFLDVSLEQGSSKTLCIVDRLVVPEKMTEEFLERLAETIGVCFNASDGACVVLARNPCEAVVASPVTIDGGKWYMATLRTDPVCPGCDRRAILDDPRLFSFQNPFGACPKCRGTGLLRQPRSGRMKLGVSKVCPECGGRKLGIEARNVRIGETSIDQVTSWNSNAVDAWLNSLPEFFTREDLVSLNSSIRELQRLIEILRRIGLQDLSWDRNIASLSTGERSLFSVALLAAHRVVHALYVLEEPTKGLHHLDRLRLIEVLRDLRQAGNTLLVVDHDPAMISASEWIVELGPGAGKDGGRIVYSGPTDQYPAHGEKSFVSIRDNAGSARLPTGHIQLNRLEGGRVEFPLGVLCVVAGVSGSGKSKLVFSELAPPLRTSLSTPGCSEIQIAGPFDHVVVMDDAVRKTSLNGMTVTSLGIWSEIRSLFAATDEARRRMYDLRTFGLSRNSEGKCPECQGTGVVSVDLKLLPDLKAVCSLCRGAMYRPEILEITYRGLTISEVLELDIQQALTQFRGENPILKKLTSAASLGLQALRLGLPTSTLSAGDLQRIKLALHLSKRTGKSTVFLLDEPSGGLHPSEVAGLVSALRQLVDTGNSVILVDNHPLLLKAADEILDLGCQGGKLRGEIVSRGKLERLLEDPRSSTTSAPRHPFENRIFRE